ncbi:hypothetical protein EIP91_003209 [Steccherinum ochraceum]|uniref:Uncharacterized protein n=1 Tax=Steccherinum ochraceum TaxID=92696 RepID=A0A4R0RUV3_9APHY|nr:hypothetical protein EIP91_003209 [Steccherinum ochraceum]
MASSSTSTTLATTSTTVASKARSPDSNDALNVSLEPHLIELLVPLSPVLPSHLRDQLTPVLHGSNVDLAASSKTTRVIRYSLLRAVSAWTRSEEGRIALQGQSPPLQPNAYTMVSLLAGTQTSPERTFPKHEKAVDPEEEAHRDRSDRRAITALLNALLSILGSGVAVFWAADRLHWRDEWKLTMEHVEGITGSPGRGSGGHS